MFNTIIVPTDFSNDASTIDSLKKAVNLSSNGRVILLHVLDEIPAFAAVELPSSVVQEQIPKAQEKMKLIVSKSGIDAQIKIRKGRSYSEIIEEAIESKAGLILINSHRPGIQNYLLGSTAAKVVRHAPCSVFVDR